jgi:hypothetical protein
VILTTAKGGFRGILQRQKRLAAKGGHKQYQLVTRNNQMKLMIKSIGKISLAGILLALAVGVPLSVSAQDQTPPATSGTPAAPAKPKAIPFKGKLVAVDKTAMTVTVGKRTFEVTSETKVFKDGKPATLDDGVVGGRVTGSYLKTDDGKLKAKSIYFGGKPSAAVPAASTGTNAPPQ